VRGGVDLHTHHSVIPKNGENSRCNIRKGPDLDWGRRTAASDGLVTLGRDEAALGEVEEQPQGILRHDLGERVLERPHRRAVELTAKDEGNGTAFSADDPNLQ